MLKYYQDHPSLKNREQFTAGILRAIASEINGDLNQGKFLDALKFESKYAKTWLHANHRFDIAYFKGRAFEQAGAWNDADRYYHEVNDDLNRIAGTLEEKQRRVAEFLPKRSTLQLRMAAVAIERRRYAEAYQDLRQVDKASDLDDAEKIEHVQLVASVAEYRGDWGRAKAALKDVIKSWKEIRNNWRQCRYT